MYVQLFLVCLNMHQLQRHCQTSFLGNLCIIGVQECMELVSRSIKSVLYHKNVHDGEIFNEALPSYNVYIHVHVGYFPYGPISTLYQSLEQWHHTLESMTTLFVSYEAILVINWSNLSAEWFMSTQCQVHVHVGWLARPRRKSRQIIGMSRETWGCLFWVGRGRTF